MVHRRVSAHRLLVRKAQAVDLFMGGRICAAGIRNASALFCYGEETASLGQETSENGGFLMVSKLNFLFVIIFFISQIRILGQIILSKQHRSH